MRAPPLLADFIQARGCKPICEKSLTLPALQVCLDSGAKKVLLPMTSAAELRMVPADLIGSFNLIFYSSAEDAVFKALGVE